MRKEAPPPRGRFAPLVACRQVFFYFLQMQSPPTVHQATCQSKNYLELENNLEKKWKGGSSPTPQTDGPTVTREGKNGRGLFDIFRGESQKDSKEK